MPLIPEFEVLTGGNYQPAVADGRTAAAPAMAARGVAAGVADLGEAFGGIAQKIARMDDNRAANQAQMLWDDAEAEHAKFRLENRDEEGWEADRKKRIGEARNKIAELKMSPGTRDEVEQRLAQWDLRGSTRVMEDTLRQRAVRARQTYSNNRERLQEEGRFDEAEEVTRDAIAKGTLSREEGDADLHDIGTVRKTWEEKKADELERVRITQDPLAWMDSNPATKLPEGRDAVRYAQQQDFAQRALLNLTQNTTATIMDGMSGPNPSVTTPEQIDQLASDLRPSVRELLKGKLAERAKAGDAARRASPEYQNRLAGTAADLLNAWTPASDGFDADLAEIVTVISEIDDPGTKAGLTEQLRDLREGRQRLLDTNRKLAEEALLEAYKANRFGDVSGTGKAGMKTEAAIDDGLLTDTDKLARAGFTAEQVKKIANKDLKPTERKQLFQELFSKRTGEDKLTRFERAAMLAVRNGETAFEIDDPEALDAAVEARDKAREKMGAARRELANFALANPKATKEEYEAEVYRLAGAEARKKMQETMVSPRPGGSLQGGPPGASNSTSPKPVGKELVEVVKNFEAADGFFPKAYWDYGQWSIGYGTKSKEGETITQAEADQRLASELAAHRVRVEAEVKKAGLKLNGHELDALVSFDFNTGEIERLLAGGRRGKQEIADKMLLYRNATEGGKLVRLRGLEQRRQAERELFLHGYD